jgi:predicted DNA-binding transcriptional regulator YafY
LLHLQTLAAKYDMYCHVFEIILGVRADRLLSILMMLQLRPRTTASQLAKQLEVSERTIYRDIEALERSGVPIITDRGRSGGLRLMDGYQTKLTGLTADEAEALPFAQLGIAASALGLGGAAQAARLKIFAALPTSERDRALRASERFHLDPVEWYQSSPTPACLKEVASAVLADHAIAIDYESWQSRKVRVVDPLGLVLKAGAWYMVARHRKRCSIYRLENIQSIRILPRRKVQRRSLPLAEVWQQEVARFEASLRRMRATVRINNSAMSRVNRLGANAAEAIRAAAPDRDGWRTVTIWIESVPHAAGLLLGFDSDVEVLSPEALRQEIRVRAKGLTALYSRATARLARAAPDAAGAG